MTNNKGISQKHSTGIYVQDIPVDPLSGLASIPFREADDRGYYKLDFLNVSVYQLITDQAHYDKLLATTPPWHRLADPDFVKQIIHIGNYPGDVKKAMPDSIPRLAMFIAALRPAKKHLIGKSWKEMAKTIWIKPTDGKYAFKKAHSVSYGVLVALHMNIVDEG